MWRNGHPLLQMIHPFVVSLYMSRNFDLAKLQVWRLLITPTTTGGCSVCAPVHFLLLYLPTIVTTDGLKFTPTNNHGHPLIFEGVSFYFNVLVALSLLRWYSQIFYGRNGSYTKFYPAPVRGLLMSRWLPTSFGSGFRISLTKVLRYCNVIISRGRS